MRPALLHRWPPVAALAVGMQLLVVTVGVAEEDHLEAYKIKDVNQVAASQNPVTITNQFGSESCKLKKPQFFLVQSEKNGEDDARGGPAGDFVCYKAKCTGTLPYVTDADSELGVHQLETKKAKLVCLPVDKLVCGDGDVDPGETCDGTDDDACPGTCQPNCTCQSETVARNQTCGNDVREETEACDGTDATDCPDDCGPDCTCASECPAGGGDGTACRALGSQACFSCCFNAGNNCRAVCEMAARGPKKEPDGGADRRPYRGPRPVGCHSGPENDACAIIINAAGCADECCP